MSFKTFLAFNFMIKPFSKSLLLRTVYFSMKKELNNALLTRSLRGAIASG